MEWIAIFLQGHALIAVFLAVGCGFWLGKVRIKGFSMGPVAATLVVGVVIGQLKISVPDALKTVFFLLFLFSLGYSVGPQFFRSFRGQGTRQALFAVVMAIICGATVIVAAKLMGYNEGIAAGLFAGSQTASASLGVLADTVRELPADPDRREYLLMIIPACYAVTYVFGTIGSAWYLSVIGPKMMGGLDKVKADAAAIEQSMDGGTGEKLSPGQIKAGRPVAFRAYSAEGDLFSKPQTAHSVEAYFDSLGARIIVERIKHGDTIVTATPDAPIERGDTIVVGGRTDAVIREAEALGPEVADAQLLNFSASKTPVTIARGDASGITLGELRSRPWMDGIMIASLTRGGMSLPVRKLTVAEVGDVITIVGYPRAVEAAAAEIGYADPPTDVTDMVFVGLGIAAGCILGSLALKVSGIPLSLGLSGGTLIAGLTLGWLRSRRPTFGHIPPAVLWAFNNLGLTMFIAVIGISAGASFLRGIHEAGVIIFLVGAVCTLLTLTLGIIIGRKLFRFSTPVTLGCVAGSRASVAAIGAVLDRLESDVPNLGYTVTYTVANIFLVLASLPVLFLT